MTHAEWLQWIESELLKAGVATARLDAQVLLEHVTDIERSQLIVSNRSLSDEHAKLLSWKVAERVARKPLAYIIGTKEFYGLDFAVNESVLIPRPETELLVEHVITSAPDDAKVLEVGTGSGCIAVSIAVNRPDTTVEATDVSVDALNVARKNASTHHAAVTFLESNLFESLSKTYDVICANLPYVPTDTRHEPELEKEPQIALYGGEDGLDLYRQFFEHIRHNLNKKGWLVIEASPTQHAQLVEIGAEQGLQARELSEYITRFDQT